MEKKSSASVWIGVSVTIISAIAHGQSVSTADLYKNEISNVQQVDEGILVVKKDGTKILIGPDQIELLKKIQISENPEITDAPFCAQIQVK